METKKPKASIKIEEYEDGSISASLRGNGLSLIMLATIAIDKTIQDQPQQSQRDSLMAKLEKAIEVIKKTPSPLQQTTGDTVSS